MPVTTPDKPSGALFRALRDAQADPDLAHEASEEVRSQAGQNVIAVMESRFAEIHTTMDSRFAEVKAEIQSLANRIDILQRVIWPLIGILATTVFGLLYQIAIK